MCLYLTDSSACAPQAVRDREGTVRPLTGPATITVSGSGLAQGVVYQLAVIARDRVGCRTLEKVSLELQNNQPATLVLSCLPSPDPIVPPSSGQALVGQLPTVEGVEARIDIP